MKSTRAYTMTARAGSAAATRQRIIDTAKALFLEHPFEDVTLAAIASAAEVSHQTVLNHFASKEGVALAVADALAAETHRARRARPGDVDGAVRALVGHYERIGDANFRWAASADRVVGLASLMDDARAGHQAWLQEMFGDHLPAGAVARRRTVNALHAATDVYTWKLLRRDLGLSRRETERTVAETVGNILEGVTR